MISRRFRGLVAQCARRVVIVVWWVEKINASLFIVGAVVWSDANALHVRC